jgi:hypothetical protein
MNIEVPPREGDGGDARHPTRADRAEARRCDTGEAHHIDPRDIRNVELVSEVKKLMAD